MSCERTLSDLLSNSRDSENFLHKVLAQGSNPELRNRSPALNHLSHLHILIFITIIIYRSEICFMHLYKTSVRIEKSFVYPPVLDKKKMVMFQKICHLNKLLIRIKQILCLNYFLDIKIGYIILNQPN